MTPHTRDRPFDLWITMGPSTVSVCLTTVRESDKLTAQLLCQDMREVRGHCEEPYYLYPEEWTE